MNKNKLFIIMEYAEGGDLKSLIQRNIDTNSYIDEETVNYTIKALDMEMVGADLFGS
jgi:hypothetical protein